MRDPAGRPHFEKMILPHLDAAYNLARWILRDDADARDVAQEAAMRAWRYFDTLRGHEPLPWLLSIVRNTAFTWLERHRRDDACENLSGDALLPDPTTIDPAHALCAEIDASLLRGAVEALPAEFREAVVLRELEGLSYKQIASVTGVSIGTVMSRLSRGRKRLQLALAPAAPQESPHEL